MEQLTNEELTAKLTELLQTGPLYRELVYAGAQISILPQHFRLHCPTCGTDQTWLIERVQSPRANIDMNGLFTRKYSCNNCNKSSITYFFLWHAIDAGTRSFQKTGQFPPLEEAVIPELEEAFDKQNLKLYRAAVRLRNFNLGLGAVAYMRRIVENHMNEILDTLYTAAKSDNATEADLKHLNDVKKAHRFDDKVTYAAEL